MNTAHRKKSCESLDFRAASSCNVRVDLKVSLGVQVWPNLATDRGSGSLLSHCLWNALVRGIVLKGAALFVTSLLNWFHNQRISHRDLKEIITAMFVAHQCKKKNEWFFYLFIRHQARGSDILSLIYSC